MNPAEISVAELRRLRDDRADFVLLDVREDDELATVRVDFARHIPMKQVPERLAELPRDKQLVLMCHHGSRSARVTRYLRENGYPQAVNLEGGIDAWAAEVDPALARY